MVKISASILSADFACLADDCRRALDAGADWLHIDVMDGHFVPNISYGAPVLSCLHKALPQAYYDVHLMISDPAGYAAALGLVPCLAVSRDGVRLGRGGGYYDRFLAYYKGAGLLLCPEALLLDELPCDDWDARFAPENILTEKGILR